jgi:predicted nucleic acid-binding protein
MIAADTSSLVAYFNGRSGVDAGRLASALAAGDLVLPPIVLTEILSDPVSSTVIEELIRQLPILEIDDGYWIRAGHARRIVLGKGFKTRVGDALIAQSCIDHDVALITRDRDFRHFVAHCGLKLAA